jgi:hypothetical protein
MQAEVFPFAAFIAGIDPMPHNGSRYLIALQIRHSPILKFAAQDPSQLPCGPPQGAGSTAPGSFKCSLAIVAAPRQKSQNVSGVNWRPMPGVARYARTYQR